tara:strand:- start:26961 stop:27257 length:297 start_codon:yes stop_codon:yes gene_type:complete
MFNLEKLMTSTTGLPRTAKERGKIAPAKFAHIVFQTSRYDEMVPWYKTVLEAETMFEGPAGIFLTYDDEHHRVAIFNMPHLADCPTAGQRDGTLRLYL